MTAPTVPSRRTTAASRRTGPIGRAIAAGALAALLAGCGSLGPTTSASSAATGKGPKHLRIVGAGGGASAAAGAAPAAASAATTLAGMTKQAAGDQLAAPFAPPTYVVQGELPPLDGDADAWTYPAGGADVTASAVAKLARTLGLDGAVASLPADQGGGFRVGPDDGSAPALYVANDAFGSWSYSGPSGSVGFGCANAAGGAPLMVDDSGVSPTTIDFGGCEAPPAPSGVPSADEAKAKARDLAGLLGLSAKSDDIEVNGDDYARFATISTELGGVRSPMTMSAGWGAAGALQWASGQLAKPQKADRYPRIGTAAAVEALRKGQDNWFGWGMPMAGTVGAMARDAVATAGVTTTASAPPPTPTMVVTTIMPSTVPPSTTTSAAHFEPAPTTSCAAIAAPSTVGGVAKGVASAAVEPGCVPGVEAPIAIDPGPVGPPISIEPVVITITGARPSFVQVWAEDGSVWLLPGYEFRLADGGSIVAPAIDDSYVEVVAPQAPAIGPGVPTTTPPVSVYETGPVPTPVPDALLPTTTSLACSTPPCP